MAASLAATRSRTVDPRSLRSRGLERNAEGAAGTFGGGRGSGKGLSGAQGRPERNRQSKRAAMGDVEPVHPESKLLEWGTGPLWNTNGTHVGDTTCTNDTSEA